MKRGMYYQGNKIVNLAILILLLPKIFPTSPITCKPLIVYIIERKTGLPDIHRDKISTRPSVLERKTGLEPATYSLEGCRSTKWATSAFFLSGRGRIRTSEDFVNRFTVCPIWPLWNSPIWNCGAGGRIRTPDLLITNQLLYRLSYTSTSSARFILAKL